MSAQNTFMTAIKASEKGAYDYLPKPFDLKELIGIVGRALAEPRKLAAQPEEEGPKTCRWSGVRRPCRRSTGCLARLMQTDLTVMISGESGTGKELGGPRAARLRQTPQRPVCRHQHGRHPA
jgi:two-component system nitrogen regulation response regulator GlnG